MMDFVLRSLGVDSIVPVFNGLAIGLAAVVTLFGFYLSRRGAIRAEQSKNAYELVTIFENENFRSNFKRLKPFLNARKPLPGYAEMDARMKKDLSVLLLEMEKVSVAVRKGYLSEDYIALIARTGLVALFRCARIYLHSARRNLKARSYFENYEMLVIRMAIVKKGLLLTVLEWILARPLFVWSLYEFRLDHWICCRMNSDLDSDWLLADWEGVETAHRNLRAFKLLVVTLGAFFLIFAMPAAT